MTCYFACRPDNDLFKLVRSAGQKCARFNAPQDAISAATRQSPVFILADRYPDAGPQVDDQMLSRALDRNLRVFVEFPNLLAGLPVGPTRQARWERVVVSSDRFIPDLQELQILAPHDCLFRDMKADRPLLIAGRVAGYNSAVYGLPATRYPILFDVPDRNLLVATTCLSKFVRGRYAPVNDWRLLWREILRVLDPRLEKMDFALVPPVRPALDASSPAPRGFQKKTFDAAAKWYRHSRLLVPASRQEEVRRQLLKGEETTTLPESLDLAADGSCGVLEGYASMIRHDGTQLQRLPIRADCVAETAMVLALDAKLNQSKRSSTIARNLLDYLYFTSNLHGGKRGDPRHPAYGLVSWGTIAPAWERSNYGDDNARVLMASTMAAAALGSDRWDASILRALLANLRTTGRMGFRGDSLNMEDLEPRGWKAYHDAEPVNYSPHFEAYLWACYLWAYDKTHRQEFLDKARTAITMTMAAYPGKWRWGDNSERAQMLLSLAWLVRVDDTPEHRKWVETIARDLLANQQPCGAIPEWLSGTGGGHYVIPQSNEAYGTGETPLIQKNGDPSSDQLYTTGFALFGLHEAAAATGDPVLREAERRLADYLCRIQVRAPKHDWLNGAWFRAFDYERWDYWSSSADAGWGAWSVESGWGQAWIAAVIAARHTRTDVWSMTRKSAIAHQLEAVDKQMSLGDGGPWKQVR